MKLGRILLLTIFLVLAFALAIPYFIDVNSAKKKFIENFESETSKSITIDGDISFKLLPQPTINLQQVKIQITEDSALEINTIELGVSWSSIFGSIPEIKSISIANSTLNFLDLQNFYKSLPQEQPVSSAISNIGLKRVIIAINPQSDFFGTVNIQEGNVSYVPGKYLSSSIICNIDGINYDIDSNFTDLGEDSDSSYINVKADFGSIEFKGKADLKTQQIQGKAFIKLFEEKQNINKYTNITHAILGDDFVGSMEVNFKNNQLDFSNLQFSSQSISKGIGNLQLILGYWNELTLDYSIDQIDLDSYIKSHNNQIANSVSLEKFLKSLLNSFNLDFPDNITGSISGNISNILINSQKIENFNIQSNLFQGKLILNEMGALLPGQTKFYIQGSLSHNDIRPKFSGEIDLNTSNFSELAKWLKFDEQITSMYGNEQLVINSEIDLIPRSLRFDKMKLAIGDLRSMGKLSIKHYGENKLYVSSSMRYNKLDLDTIKWTESINNYFKEIYSKDYLKDPNTILDASGDFTWLRKFPIDLTLDIDIDNLIYKGVTYSKASLEATITSNVLHLEKFNLNSQDGSARGDIKFTILGIDPKIEGKLIFDRLNDQFIPKLLPSSDELNLAKHEALKAANVSTKEVDPNYISFFSLNGITIDLDVNVKDYKSNKIKFQNGEAKLISQNGYINLLKLTADAFSGKLAMTGNLSIGSLVTNFNTNFTINNFELDDFLQPLFGYKNLNGFASISGALNGKGVKWSDFLNSISGSIDVLGKKVGWEGFDLGQIISTADSKARLTDKITNLNYYTQNGETVFEDLSGSITINNGLASLKDFKMANARVSGAYAANILLPTFNIASSATFSFIPISRATPLNISLQSTGTINNPKTIITMDDLNAFILSQARIEFQQVEDENTKKLLRNRIVIGGDNNPAANTTNPDTDINSNNAPAANPTNNSVNMNTPNAQPATK